MAEELEQLADQSEQTLDLSSFNTLPARPEALDVYENIVGNPLSGGDPVKKVDKGNTLDFARQSAKDAQIKMATTEGNPYAAMKPFIYSGDTDVTNFERYYSTGDVYDQLGFNPYDNKTEDIYNNKMTFGDQFRRAASQWDNLVGAGFMSGVKSWGTLFTDPLAPDMEAARAMKKAMSIGSSNVGGVGGFLTNTFLNSGYTIGIGFEFLAEEIALGLATAATGGLAGAVTTPAMLTRAETITQKLFGIGKAGDAVKDSINTIGTAGDINKMDGIKNITDVNAGRSFWNSLSLTGAAKGAFDLVNPLENTVQALRATDYASNLAKTSKTFGAFIDDVIMIKGAVAEAKVEAGMTKIDVTEDLIKEYTNINGFAPEGKDLAEIEALATEKAYGTGFWNMPAIMTSNKLVYAALFAPFRKVMGRELTRTVDDYIFRNGKFADIGENFFARAAETGKQLLKPKTFGKLGMNYLKANLAEGIQENIQEAISSGARDHALAMYRDPIRASYEGYMTHFMKGMKDQFSAQGAETFAGGFLMGMFAQPIMGAASMSLSKVISLGDRENYKAAKEMREQIRKQEVAHLNEMYDNELTYVAPDLQHAIRTGRLADDMFTAGKLGNKKEAADSKDAIENHHLLNAIKTGKLDIFLKKITDYKNLSRKEVVEAFGKYGIEEQDVDKALGMIDQIVARAKSTKEVYENEVKNFPNPFNPNKFAKGTRERKAAFIAKTAWDEAVYNLVFAKATFQSTGDRIKSIGDTFSKISEKLAGEDAQSLMTLLSSKTAVAEINALRQEIGVLSDDIPEQKKTKKEKQERLDRINTFYDAVASVKFAKNDAEKAQAEQKAKDAFYDYVGFLSEKNGTLPFKDAIDEAYNMVKDSMLLQNDMAGLARSINVLMTPDSFFEFHRRLNTTYTEIFDKKADIISANREQFEMIESYNAILKSIKQSGLDVPQGFLEQFIKAHNEKKPYPTIPYFLDADGNQVTSGKQFDEAMQKWNNFIGLLRKEAAAEEAKFDPRDLSTYPEGLVEILQNKYDLLDDEIKANTPFEEWAIAEEQAGVRAAYFRISQQEYQGIDEKYKNMTTQELQNAHEELQKAAAEDISLLEEEKQVADYLAYRKMRDLNLTTKQTQAINSLKAMNNDVEMVDNKYVINGVPFDMRVTGLVYDVIMKGDPYNKTVTKYSTSARGKAIMSAAKSLFENKGTKSNTEVINEWLNKVEGNSNFQDFFDEGKINLIKSELKEKDGYEEFENIVNEYAYYESRSAGDVVDNVLKNFFDGNPVRKPDNMSEQVYENIRESFHAIMSTIHGRNEVVLARNLVVTGEVEVDGKKKTIAGEIDLLTVNPDGTLRIYDIKTGKSTRWENYGLYVEEDGKRIPVDEYYTKEGYTLQLSMYKALIEAKTGLKVGQIAIIPFVISTDLQGNIKSLELSREPRHITHVYDPTVEKYIKPADVTTLAPEAVVQEPVQRMSPEELKLRQDNIELINQKIKILRDKADLLGIEDLYIDDTLENLNDIYENALSSVDISLEEVKKQMQIQIQVLSDTVKSSTAAKTKRGARVAETIERLREEVKNITRKDFDHLNSIVDSIKELQEESRTLKGIQEDLNKQIKYYNSLIADPTLGTLDKEQLTKRRDAIQGKVNTVSKLLKLFSDAIRKSINYIREYIKEVFNADAKLSEFTKATGFKQLTQDEIRTLMKSNLEEDQVFLDNYFKLKDEFENLQERVNDNIDTVEMLEASKAVEEEKRTKLNEVLLKYQDQIRYIDELLVNEQVKDSEYKVGKKDISTDPNKPNFVYFLTRNGERLDVNFATEKEGNDYIKKLNTKKKTPAVKASVTKGQPKRTRKKAEKKEVTKRTKAQEKKLAKEEEEVAGQVIGMFSLINDAVYNNFKKTGKVPQNVIDLLVAKRAKGKPFANEREQEIYEANKAQIDKLAKGEKKKEVIETEPEQESVPSMFGITQEIIDELNQELDLLAMKTAMKRKLNVVYTTDSGEKITTRVSKIGAKSVTLNPAVGDPIKVAESELQSKVKIELAEPLKATKEENDLVKKNEETIRTTERSIPTKKDLTILKGNFIKNLC